MRHVFDIHTACLKYRVEIATVEEDPALTENHGYCDHEKCIVRLRETADAQRLLNTLLHELLHVVNGSSGLDHWFRERFKMNANQYDAFEETFVELYTPHLLAALTSSGLLKWEPPVKKERKPRAKKTPAPPVEGAQ